MQMQAQRRISLVLSDWLLGGGALLAIVTAGLGYLENGRGRTVTLRVEACKRAHEAIIDDGLNPSLREAQKAAFLRGQLRISAQCDRDIGR
jgi:hypothetical protein